MPYMPSDPANALASLEALDAPTVPLLRPGFKCNKPDSKTPNRCSSLKDWLYPKMPKHLAQSQIRPKSREWLLDRYIQVYSASMGNHSVSRFYCHWTMADYEAETAADPAFAEAIRNESLNIADRAKYLLHEGLGLLTCVDEAAPITNTAALNILARLEGELRERGEIEADRREQAKTSGRRRAVFVEGLERPKAPSSEGAGAGAGSDSPAV
jgi:hypothetical protein